MAEGVLKAFDRPDEVREFPFGRFEVVHIAGVTMGRATYQPGWKWSIHNGQYLDLLPGTVFHITTTPHDSWVIGDVPYVSLHVLKSA